MMKRKATLNDNDGAVELGTMTRNLKLSGEEPAPLQEKAKPHRENPLCNIDAELGYPSPRRSASPRAVRSPRSTNRERLEITPLIFVADVMCDGSTAHNDEAGAQEVQFNRVLSAVQFTRSGSDPSSESKSHMKRRTSTTTSALSFSQEFLTTVEFGTLKVMSPSQQTDVLVTERVLQEAFSDSAAKTKVITEHHVLQRDSEQKQSSLQRISSPSLSSHISFSSDLISELLDSHVHRLCVDCNTVLLEVSREKHRKCDELIQRAKTLHRPSLSAPMPPLSELMLQDSELGESKEIQFAYACQWEASAIEMNDICEDGMPPDQRASLLRHSELAVTIKSVTHLPQEDAFGKCDPFITLTFFEQNYTTEVHKKCYDTTFDETFIVFVHSANVDQANAELNNDKSVAAGLALKLECWDHHTIGKNSRIGAAHILLRPLLALGSDGGSHEMIFEKDMFHEGELVVGQDGQNLHLTVSVMLVESEDHKMVWQAPTLADSLLLADGSRVAEEHIADAAEEAVGSSTTRTRSFLSFLPDGKALKLSEYSVESNQDSLEESRGEGRGWWRPSARRQNATTKMKTNVHQTVTKRFSTENMHKKAPSAQNRASSKKGQSSFYEHDDETDKHTLDSNDTYWRESLEKFLETLTVNISVMLLVLVDVFNVIVSVVSNNDTYVQTAITFIVLALFLIELSLRQIAQGKRFWHSSWNIFDVVVIYASAIMAVVKFDMEEKAKSAAADSSSGGDVIAGAQSATTPLRIFGRVAMGMRVLRVLVHMRKVNELKGTVTTKLRTAVSQNKRRYLHHGFDLDLTYITDRVIAMSAPALGGHKTYRNDCHVVSRFLSLRHYASFFVFNLCDTYISSDGSIGNYHPQMFFNQVQRIPFEDHGPPLLIEMIHFCREASKWLQRDAAHVVNVHCKGGKGRTGVMIAALLLWCGHRKCAMDAMELFTFRRTQNYDPDAGIDESVAVKSVMGSSNKKQPNRGVDGPSQQRYVFYIEAMLYQGIQPLNASQTILKALRFPAGAAQEAKSWYLSFTVKSQRTTIYDSFGHKGAQARSFGGANDSGMDLTMPVNVTLCEDTKIEMYRHKSAKEPSRTLMWFVVFHPAFYQGKTEIVFAKKKVDMLHKDSRCSKADANFTLTLEVSTSIDDPTIALEKTLHSLFEMHGEVRNFSAGEHIKYHDDSTGELVLIMSGLAEAVVNEEVIQSRGEHSIHFHPTGFPIPDFGQKAPERVPIHTVLGAGHVLGVSDFLKSKASLPFRARTDVCARILLNNPIRVGATSLDAPSHTLAHLHRNSLKETPVTQADIVYDICGSRIPPYTKETAISNPGSPMRKLSSNFSIQEQESEEEYEGGGVCVEEESEIKRLPSMPRHTASLALRERRAWLVYKRLNVVQTDWRCLEIDGNSKVIINKKIPEIESANANKSHQIVPRVSEQEMLDSPAAERKRLQFDDLAQVIQYSETNLRVTLKFHSLQKPYQIEFLCTSERNDFIKMLRQHLAHVVFQLRIPPSKSADNTIKQEDLEIRGVATTELPVFYQALAHKLTLQLDRTRTECIRISRLKALSDTDSLMLLYDEREQLRLASIRIFGLPVSEKMVLLCKCFLTNDEMKTGGQQRMRMIIVTNYVVMDTAVFGPSISKTGSTMLRIDQLYEAYDNVLLESNSHSFCLKAVLENGEIAEWKIAFSTAATCHRVRASLSDMCTRGVQVRESLCQRPFDDPGIKRIIEKCGSPHHLIKGQELVEARTSDSLFLVQSGGVTQTCDKLVYRLLREGSCFGETNFVKGSISSQFAVRANCTAVVIELRRELVRGLTGMDAHLEVRYWYTLCKVINNGLLESMESTFPGTWSMSQKKKAQHANKKGESLASSPIKGRSQQAGTPRVDFSPNLDSFQGIRKRTSVESDWPAATPYKPIPSVARHL